jgi:[ribosomal protein S5]-alanine N-acetyltransferase
MQILPESERLLFRPHLITDLDDFCAMEMDLNVRRYVGGYPRSREEAEKRFPGNQARAMVTNRLGRGFATEAGRAFIDFGFNELGIHRIVTAVMEGNDASLHVLQKLGFTTVRIEKGPRTFHHLIVQAPLQNK